jgi:hypothetical protein
MTNQAESNSREKTLGENVIIIVLIATLMASFLYYFFKQEQRLTKVGFDAVARKFSSSVLAVRAQWFMDGQPDEIILKEIDKANVTLKLNSKGWIDFEGEKERCQKIWLSLMTTDLYFMNQPIAIIEINSKKNGANGIEIKMLNTCRYSLPTGESFDYYLGNGKVSEITIR